MGRGGRGREQVHTSTSFLPLRALLVPDVSKKPTVTVRLLLTDSLTEMTSLVAAQHVCHIQQTASTSSFKPTRMSWSGI